MFNYQQNLLLKQLQSDNFKIIILDKQAESVLKPFLTPDLFLKHSICAISDLKTNIQDLTAVAELVIVISAFSLADACNFIQKIIKAFKITVIFIDKAFENVDSETDNQQPFKAFQYQFLDYVTRGISVCQFQAFKNAIFSSNHANGFDYVRLFGQSQALEIQHTNIQLTLFQGDFIKQKLLFNKFRTFLTFGGLMFEFYDLLNKQLDQNAIDSATTDKYQFQQEMKQNALYQELSQLPLQQAIEQNLQLVKNYKIQKERLQKSQNLQEIANCDVLKQQIDQLSSTLKQLLEVCKFLKLQEVKDLEDEVLSGSYGIELFRQKTANMNPYCVKKLQMLYQLTQGKQVNEKKSAVQVVENTGLLQRSKKLSLEALAVGARYTTLQDMVLGKPQDKATSYIFFDSEMVFGEICEDFKGVEIGIGSLVTWQEAYNTIE